jgi:RNA polymerase sigma factor for flagellar operon FliA
MNGMNGLPLYQPLVADQKDRLIKSHLYLVSLVVERMICQVPSFMTREDIASAAMLGLVDAAGRFDAKVGVLFKTFAERRMRGAVMDEVRRTDWFSRSMRQKQSLVTKTIDRLGKKLGRQPEEAEVATELDMNLEDYRALLGDISHLGCVSLHETLEDSGQGASLLDTLADPDVESPLETLESHELTKELAGYLERLTEKEQLVISLYYYEELSQKEIAEVLDISEGRVSQLHSQALVKLKVSMERSSKRARSPFQKR